jgi:PhnB protein
MTAKAARAVPAGYHTVTPYLIVANARKSIDFLTKAFGATTAEALHADDEGNVRHAEVKIGDSMVMIGQARDQWQPRPASFYLYVEDCDAWYNRAMSAGATSLMEPADQFYGDRNAGVQDPDGTSWWIGTHIEDVSPEEMQRRANAAYAKEKK